MWPGPLGWAAIVCALQGLTLFGVEAVAWSDRTDTLSADIAQAVCLCSIAVGLLALAWALINRRRWARGPTITIEIITVLIAVSEAKLTTGYGWVIGVPALVALVIVYRSDQWLSSS